MKYPVGFRAGAALLLLPVALYSGYSAAAGNAHGFLQYLNKDAAQYQENQATADAYYAAIDPNNLRLNLSAFKKFNALTGNTVATYVNDADLGFGRRMYVKANTDGSVASCVENYAGPTKDVSAPAQVKINSAKAHLASELLASVCMEYTGTLGTESPSNGIPNTAVAPNVLMSGRNSSNFLLTMVRVRGLLRRIWMAKALNLCRGYVIPVMEAHRNHCRVMAAILITVIPRLIFCLGIWIR
jgi:hypothetical protein